MASSESQDPVLVCTDLRKSYPGTEEEAVAGVCFSVDNVTPQVTKVGLGRHFLARSLLEARRALAGLYEAWGRPEKAESWGPQREGSGS